MPTKKELDDLLNYVDEKRSSENSFLALIAKSKAWTNYSEEGGDDFNFNALPAGSYGRFGDGYQYVGEEVQFWSVTPATEYNFFYAYYLQLDSESTTQASIIYGDKDYGLSARCVKND